MQKEGENIDIRSAGEIALSKCTCALTVVEGGGATRGLVGNGGAEMEERDVAAEEAVEVLVRAAAAYRRKFPQRINAENEILTVALILALKECADHE